MGRRGQMREKRRSTRTWQKPDKVDEEEKRVDSEFWDGRKNDAFANEAKVCRPGRRT